MNPLLDETKAALGALAAVADRTSSASWPKVVAAIRATCESVANRLESSEVAVLVLGGKAKRAIFDELAGEPLFGATTRGPPSAVVTLRRGKSARYVARMADGGVEDFARVAPDREPWFRETLRNARLEADALTVKIADLKARIEHARASAATAAAGAEATTSAETGFFAALFVRLVGWLSGLFGRRALLAPAPASTRLGARAEVEAKMALRDLLLALEAAETEQGKARARIGRVETEAAQHVAERRKAFAAAVRALTDGDQRGREIVELTIEVTHGSLPDGVALVDAPLAMSDDAEVRRTQWKHLRDTINACIVVPPIPLGPAELDEGVRPLVPLVFAARDGAAFVDHVRAEMPGVLERIRAYGPLAALALATADLPARIRALRTAAGASEAESRARIETLERERLPEPAAFRTDQLQRRAGAIAEGARTVVGRSLEQLRAAIAQLDAEWTAAIDACTSRRELAACIATIDAGARARIRGLVEDLGDRIGAEMQSASEPLQRAVLDDVRRQYKTRHLHVDAPAVVVTELPSDDPSAFDGSPLAGALRTFDRKRVGAGLGGAAVGAAIGTAIHPGAASVALAVAGLLAALVPRTAGVKADCSARVRARLATLERLLAARVEESAESFARDIRTAIDETLEQALKRRDDSIMVLLELEGETLDREKKKLDELSELRAALDGQEARFAALAESAAAVLHEHLTRKRDGAAG